MQTKDERGPDKKNNGNHSHIPGDILDTFYNLGLDDNQISHISDPAARYREKHAEDFSREFDFGIPGLLEELQATGGKCREIGYKQDKKKNNSSKESAEQEADKAAKQVTSLKHGEIRQDQIPSIRSRSEKGVSPPPQIMSEIDAHNTGTPLSESEKQYFEPRFGQNFSKVRLHTDQKAEQLACKLRSEAFTKSNDIFFIRKKYCPETLKGKELLAHELTHVVQQGDGVFRKEDNKTKKTGVIIPQGKTFAWTVSTNPQLGWTDWREAASAMGISACWSKDGNRFYKEKFKEKTGQESINGYYIPSKEELMNKAAKQEEDKDGKTMYICTKEDNKKTFAQIARDLGYETWQEAIGTAALFNPYQEMDTWYNTATGIPNVKIDLEGIAVPYKSYWDSIKGEKKPELAAKRDEIYALARAKKEKSERITQTMREKYTYITRENPFPFSPGFTYFESETAPVPGEIDPATGIPVFKTVYYYYKVFRYKSNYYIRRMPSGDYKDDYDKNAEIVARVEYESGENPQTGEETIISREEEYNPLLIHPRDPEKLYGQLCEWTGEKHKKWISEYGSWKNGRLSERGYIHYEWSKNHFRDKINSHEKELESIRYKIQFLQKVMRDSDIWEDVKLFDAENSVKELQKQETTMISRLEKYKGELEYATIESEKKLREINTAENNLFRLEKEIGFGKNSGLIYDEGEKENLSYSTFCNWNVAELFKNYTQNYLTNYGKLFNEAEKLKIEDDLNIDVENNVAKGINLYLEEEDQLLKRKYSTSNARGETVEVEVEKQVRKGDERGANRLTDYLLHESLNEDGIWKKVSASDANKIINTTECMIIAAWMDPGYYPSFNTSKRASSGHVAILMPGYNALVSENFRAENINIYHAGRYTPGESTIGRGFWGKVSRVNYFILEWDYIRYENDFKGENQNEK